MKMNFKFALLSVILCFSINMLASSLTTALQCAVPVVSGVTGYKSYQDMQDYRYLTNNFKEQNEVDKKVMLKQETREGYWTAASLGLAMGSLVIVGLDTVVEHKPTTLGFATAYSGIALVSYMYGHKKLEHAKDVVHAMPSMFDSEA